MEIKLHRGFGAAGTNINDFFDAVRSMEKVTSLLSVGSNELALGTVLNSRNDARDFCIITPADVDLITAVGKVYQTISDQEAQDKLVLYYCEPDGRFALRSLELSTFRNKAGVTDELVGELRSGSKMLVVINGRNYIVSELALNTMSNRAKIGGDSLNRPGVGRVVELAKSFHHYNVAKLQCVVRSVGDVSMLLATHSEQYEYVPQDILISLYDQIARDFGATECLSWHVNHEISGCYIGFPEVRNDFASVYKLPHTVTPGLYIATSDSGDCSLTVRGVWDINGYRLSGPCVKHKHRGEIDIPAFIEKAKQEIFPEYAAIPDRLTELLTIEVTEPEAVLKSVFREIGAAKTTALGKKASECLFAELLNEFPEGGRYTAYDIAMAIITAPSRCVGAHHTVVARMEELAKAAVFANYRRTKKDAGPSPSFILT